MTQQIIRNTIEIALITDDSFILPTGVAIYSIFVHRDINTIYNIHVICYNVQTKNKLKLLELNTTDFHIDIIDAPESELHQQFIKKDFPVTVAATFKFSIPKILPNLDKVLYLDGDILVQSNLKDFYFSNISEIYAGVIKDYHALTFKGDVWKRLGIKLEGYFNSGVMLLNLNKMRQDDITEKLIDYRLNGINYYMDQDALNVVFGKQVKYLSFNYNMTLTNWRNKTIEDLSTYYNLPIVENKYDYLRHADIIHFASSDKPWVYFDTHYADVWMQYFLLSPFCKTDLNRHSLFTIIDSENIAKVRIQDKTVSLENYKKGCYQNFSQKPFASIIIPIYNSEKYLTECLKSASMQTIGNIEIVCIDDGSTDDSVKILELWKQNDTRIKFFTQNNQGAGAARNKALTHCKGKFIIFLDSDDILTNNAVEVLISSCITENADIAVSGAYQFDKTIADAYLAAFWLKTEFLPYKNSFSPKELYEFIFNFTTGGPGGKCFRKEFIEKTGLQFLELRKSEDFFFIHLGILKADRVAIIRTPLYYMRINLTSLEHQKDKMPLAFWDAIMCFKNQLILDGLYECTKQSFINENINRFVYNLSSMNTPEGHQAVLEKLQEVFQTELGLGEYPIRYYYNQSNYNYLCSALSLNTPTSKHTKVICNKIKVNNEDSIALKNIKLDRQVTTSSLHSNHFISEIELIKHSWSFRIGRAVTWLPRKIRSAIRCCKEHGLSYTIKLAANKLTKVIRGK